MLQEVNKTRDRPIFVISDEAYRRILYSDFEFTSITSIYPYFASTYTTGKTLLAPGQRLGYIATPSIMPAPQRNVLRRALTVAKNSSWAFPSVTIMNCLDQLDQMQIDLTALEKKRNYFCGRARAAGYHLIVPHGTFYVCIAMPEGRAHSEFLLLAHRVLLPTPAMFWSRSWQQGKQLKVKHHAGRLGKRDCSKRLDLFNSMSTQVDIDFTCGPGLSLHLDNEKYPSLLMY